MFGVESVNTFQLVLKCLTMLATSTMLKTVACHHRPAQRHPFRWTVTNETVEELVQWRADAQLRWSKRFICGVNEIWKKWKGEGDRWVKSSLNPTNSSSKSRFCPQQHPITCLPGGNSGVKHLRDPSLVFSNGGQCYWNFRRPID